MLVLIFWLVILRPARKQQRELDGMIGSLKKNDQVRTSAGFFGTVVSVDRDNALVVLKVDDNKDVRMKVQLSSVAAVVTKDKKKQEAKK